jgi:hypothetical protein
MGWADTEFFPKKIFGYATCLVGWRVPVSPSEAAGSLATHQSIPSLECLKMRAILAM